MKGELEIIIIVLTLDKCPLNVLLVLIWILPMASMLTVAWDRLVSHAAFLPSLMEFLRCSASCLSCSSSFILAVVYSARSVSGCRLLAAGSGLGVA